MMRIDVVTIFPEIIDYICGTSITGRACKKGIVRIKAHDIRAFSPDRRMSVDDTAYGGGPGMILKPEPIYQAVDRITKKKSMLRNVVLLSPQGEVFTQKKARSLAMKKNLIFICGHYKGVDERVREGLVTEEISIGDYVLTGGELPVLVVIDAIVRLLPGAMSSRDSYRGDSFYRNKRLDCPYYTRPPSFRGMEVPPVLLSGNHSEIAKWRKEKSFANTLTKRPDLLKKTRFSKEEKELIVKIGNAG